MFSSVLDTVRITDEKNLTMVEAFLMRSALCNNPAVLSPNQAMDSAAIQAIVVGNNEKGENHFIRAVRLGIVRIALPKDSRSLLEYVLETFQRGVKDQKNEFRLSSLSFLYEQVDGVDVYDYNFRRKILEYMSQELSQARRRFKESIPFPVYLEPEKKEMIQCYIRTIMELDQAIEFYDVYTNMKNMFPRMLERELTMRLQATEPQTPMAELLKLMICACDDGESSKYRSYYYRLCDRYRMEFGADVVKEVREIVDICYNKLMAVSVKQKAEINISPEFTDTISTQAEEAGASQSMLMSMERKDHVTEKLDWEMLVEIYQAITSLCEKKGLSWQDALEKFYAQQSRLPFVLGGKYVAVTAVTMAISGIPFVGAMINNMVSEILLSTILDEAGSYVQKPSIKEIVESAHIAQKQIKMMDVIICAPDETKKWGNI